MASPVSRPVADAAHANWVDRFLPEGLKPYARLARLDRPIGWWLLLIPCWWGLALASLADKSPVRWDYAALFLAGAIIMRGAGCTLNDILDRDLDAAVARTRSRPIPSGQVSVAGAVAFLVLQCLAGFVILFFFNRFTILVGAASLLLVAIYPLMKRITYWPQIFLGLAFNWGALVGWSAMQDSLSTPPLVLYAGGLFWTLAYDTIYAYQDRDDDILIGVRSTALRFGDRPLPWIGTFFALALCAIDLSLWMVHAPLIAHSGIIAAACHALWQCKTLKITDPQRCLMLFKSNRTFGLLVLGGFLAGIYWP